MRRNPMRIDRSKVMNHNAESSFREEVNSIQWYHAINLGNGIVTPGRFSQRVPPNYTIFPVFQFLENISLKDMTCIDIGTTDGIVAFILKQEGARRVVATDRGKRRAFELVRERLKLEVDYLPKTTLDTYQLANLLREKDLPISYDLVILSGVIYHAYDPLLVLMHARALLRPQGLFIVETAFHEGDIPSLVFNPEAPSPVGEPNTYFLPTIKGLESMLRFCSCNPLVTVINGKRLAVLAQACRPSEIEQRTPSLELVMGKGKCFGPIDFKKIEEDRSIGSEIKYFGKTGTWSIIAKDFKTRFELQPK